MLFCFGSSFQTLSLCQAPLWEACKLNKADFCNFDLCETLKTKTTVYCWLSTLCSCKQLLKMCKKHYKSKGKHIIWPRLNACLDTVQKIIYFFLMLLLFCERSNINQCVGPFWADRSTIPVTGLDRRLPQCVEMPLFCRETRHIWLGLLSEAKYEVWFCLKWLSSHQSHFQQ